MHLLQRNSQTVIHTVFERLTCQNAAEYLVNVDVIVDCTDNFETRFVLSDCAKKIKKPLILGACTGYIGQMITLDFRLENTPCYDCLYPRYPKTPDIPVAEQGVLSPLPGLIGCSQAKEAIFMLTNSTSALSNTLWSIDIRNHKTSQYSLSIDPHCTCQHSH